MIIARRRQIVVVFGALCFLLAGNLPNAVGQSKQIAISAAPIIFEQNKGQLPAKYEFLTRRNGVEAFYFSDGMDVYVPQSQSIFTRLHVTWTDTKAGSLVFGEGELPGRSNYFRGSDPSHWIRGVPHFGRIRYTQIYPGVDLLFYGTGDELEHDFVIEPGGNPTQIAFHLNRPVHMTPSGDLEIDLGTSVLHLRKPVAFQQFGAARENVKAQFVLSAKGQVTFQVGAYDHQRALVIDPILSFATYLAGTNNDQIKSVTTDGSGNIYLTGYTSSTDFPTANPEQATFSQLPDAFVSKLDPTGHSLLFSTYIGGSNLDQGSSIVIDKNGNVVVGGISGSSDFPHAGAVQSPPTFQINGTYFFVLSLKSDGSALNYSGLIGGLQGFYTNGNNGLIATDTAGNAYLTGVTNDKNFQLTAGTLAPTVPGYPQDSAFVLKVDSTGTLVYSTIIPGNAPQNPSQPNNDTFPASGIFAGANGQVTLAGTAGIGLPTTPNVLASTLPPSNGNGQAGYLLQLNATASALNYATYLPGTDRVGALAVDAFGNSFITGSTSQPNLAVSPNAYQRILTPGPTCICNDGYIMKVDGHGTSVLAATYLGGTPIGNAGESFTGIALDSQSNVFVGGMTGAPDFPLQNPISTTLQFSISADDMVLAEISSDMSSLLFGSFLNSTSSLGGSQFGGLTMDNKDHPIVVGDTFASDFPTTVGSFQQTLPPTQNKGQIFPHGFIAKLDMSVPAPSVCFGSLSINFGSVLVNTSTAQNLQVKNCGNAPLLLTVSSSISTITASSTCGSIAPGNSCAIQVTFAPVDSSFSSGTLTITDNAAIPQQKIAVSGKGGVPQVFFPPAFSTANLFVGTQAEFPISFLNSGDGAWIVTSATATGDFSARNNCSSGAAPQLSCSIGIIFAPTAVGQRTGTLTITDNETGSPHVIQLSGNGLTTYPTPSISSISGIAMDSQLPQLIIYGTNFFPTSQVLVNGSPRTTLYGFSSFFPPNSLVPVITTVLFANLTSSDLATPTELQMTVSNPSPGGGVSNTYPVPVYAAIRNVSVMDAVFEPHSGLLYVSTSATSATDPNQVIAIDPNTQQIASHWSVGNGPNHLAVSDDGQLLYVGLDGDRSVAQVSLAPANPGTVNFTVGLGNDPLFHNPMVADALRVFPGQPSSWAVTRCGTGYEPCGQGVAIFDRNMERPTVASGEGDTLLFIGNDTSHLYGASLSIIPPTLSQFSINTSGITQTQSAFDRGGGILDTDGTLIYSAEGQVIDPGTLTLKTTIQGVPFNGGPVPAMKVDVPASRIYFAGFANTFGPGPGVVIQAFDLSMLQLQNSIGMVEGLVNPSLFRWGTNGLVLASQTGVFVLRTSLTSSTMTPPQFDVSGLSPATVFSGSGDLKVTISGNGFTSGDSVVVNGTVLQITSLTATQITVVIPASFLGTPGNVPLTITNSSNQSNYLVLVVTPGQAPVAAVSTKALTFSPQIIGSVSASQTISIANQGTGVLLISGVSLSGADFSQKNNCTEVWPGASCSVSIIFSPTGTGSRSSVLTINDNDASASQTVALSGNGTDIQIVTAGGSSFSATVTRGQPATYTLSIVPESGFTGQVTFACSNLPQYASCNITPGASIVTGAGPINVSVMVSTSQGQTSSLTSHRKLVFAGLSWLAFLGTLPLRRRIRALRHNGVTKLAFVLLITVAPVITIIGCNGGGGAAGNAATPSQIGSAMTAPGNYTVNFVATSSGVSRTTPLTLTVQ